MKIANHAPEQSRWPIVEPGIWCRVRSPCAAKAKPALFLDRDGVIVEYVSYLHRPSDVRLCDGAAELVQRANESGIPVVVVTNQAGIARGNYRWADYADVEAEIDSRLARLGARLDGVLACPFHPEFTPGFSAEHADWRKPGGAMLRLAAAMLNLALDRSWLIGDAAHDIATARGAGLAGAVHVLTGRGSNERASALAARRPGFPVLTAASIAGALGLLSPRLGIMENGASS
jgi:D-glycero-D-manno-heptose 1,7-bisphosphate phosphatase